MRKSKPRTSTSHQLCELADNVVTDIPHSEPGGVKRGRAGQWRKPLHFLARVAGSESDGLALAPI